MKNLIYRVHSELFQLREKGRDMLKNESGATMIEYSLLLALITIATILLIVSIGGKVTAAWQALDTAWT